MSESITSRDCVCCGSPFPLSSRCPDQRYCSVRCSAYAMGKANARGRRKVPCKHCGVIFESPSWRKLYCSGVCSRAGRPPRATTPPETRFWAKVDRSGECWPWTAGAHSQGYGVFHPTKRTRVVATRFAWELANDPIPPGLFVLHRCDNPRCCRPDHLFLGTIADNNRDMIAKARNAAGEKHGMAKLDLARVASIRDKYAAGQGVCSIAREFSLSHGAVSMIVHRKTWARAATTQ